MLIKGGGVALFKYNINNGRYTPYDANSLNNNPEWDNTNHLSERQRQAHIEAEQNSYLDFEESNQECPF